MFIFKKVLFYQKTIERNDVMHIAKKIISIFLALIICISVVGCGNSSGKKKKVIIIKKRPTSSATDTNDNQVSEEINSQITNSEVISSDASNSEVISSDTSNSEVISSQVSSSDSANSDIVDSGDDSQIADSDVATPEDNNSQNNDSDSIISDNGYTEEAYISERELAEKENDTKDLVEPEYKVELVDFKLSNKYTVIYPDGNEQLRQSAKKLVEYFSQNKIKVAMASDAAPKNDEEILLGDTNRKKSALGENEYAVSVSGKQIFFESGNFNGVIKAVSWFTSLEYKKTKINTLKGEYEFSSKIKRDDGVYNLVWADEFDGNTLNMSNWELTSSISAESSFKLSRDPKVINVSDGLLKLSALRWFDPDNNQIQAVAPYTIEGREHMNFQYGYLEMRARIPFGGGAWPSLWLSGACKKDAVVSSIFKNGDIIPANFSAEIDIVEYTTLQPNLHKWFYDDAEGIDGIEGIVNKHSSLGAVEKPVKSDIGLDVNQSYVYQTVGYEWTPEDMTIYLNGEVFYSYNWKESVQLDGLNDMTDFNNPVFIRINNHLIPKNIPSDYSTLPCEFFVDYVRLYQKKDVGGIWLAE